MYICPHAFCVCGFFLYCFLGCVENYYFYYYYFFFLLSLYIFLIWTIGLIQINDWLYVYLRVARCVVISWAIDLRSTGQVAETAKLPAALIITRSYKDARSDVLSLSLSHVPLSPSQRRSARRDLAPRQRSSSAVRVHGPFVRQRVSRQYWANVWLSISDGTSRRPQSLTTDFSCQTGY